MITMKPQKPFSKEMVRKNLGSSGQNPRDPQSDSGCGDFYFYVTLELRQKEEFINILFLGKTWKQIVKKKFQGKILTG